MKPAARKFLAVLCAISMIMTMIIPMAITISAETTTETITFDANKTQRISYSTTQQVWESNGVTFTNDKASSTTIVSDYSNPVRLYASSTVTITAPDTITQLEILSNGTSKYKTALENSLKGANLTYTVNSNTYTVTDLGAASVTFSLTGQARFASITVTYEVVGEGECAHDNLTLDEAASTAATCTTDGEDVYTCNNCGETVTKTVKATGHGNLTLDESASTAATCTTDGENVSTCDVCGETVTEVVKATGHGNLTLDTSKSTAPTCTESGENVYTCDVCGEVSTETVAATKHTFVDYVCTSCGYEVDPTVEVTETITFDSDKTQRTSFSSTQQVWESGNVTFTQDKASSTSNVSDYSNPVRLYRDSTITITAPVTIIKIVIVSNSTSSYKTSLENSLKAANLTYTVDGNTYTIDNIGSDSITIAMSGGQARFQSITVTYGSANEGDPDCQHTNTKVLDAKAPTCTEDGLTEGLECADCGAFLTKQTVIPAGHGNLTLDTSKSTAPTCTEAGENVFTCDVCGETVTEVVKATGHGNLTLDTSKSTAPTCTESGENVYTCDVCGEVSTETVAATKHTFVDYVCTSCGYEVDPTVEVTETITFDSYKTQRTSFSSTQQVWASDNVTFINDKASSINDIIDSSNPVRLYRNSTITITAPVTIIKIVIVSNGTSSYKTALQSSLTAAGLTYTVENNTYTIENIGTDTITVTMSGGQARFQSITVTYGSANEGDPDCQHTNTKVLDAKAPTCTEDGLTEGLMCADCEAILTKQTVIPAGHNFVDNVCTGCGATEYTETTIEEALQMADGTKIIIKNVVVAEINTAWNSNYNNITVTVKDQDTGDTLYVYRLGTNVAVGDIITIKGAMGSYNGSKQVAQGATAEIIGRVTFDDPDYVEVGIDEATTLEDGSYVLVKGTVTEINTAWNPSYGNITVTITDENGNTLYIYRLATEVALGNIIAVKGKVGSYNGAKQIIEGTAEIIGQASDVTILASGTCGADGDNLTWVLYETGELVISGTGAMANYDWDTMPWYSYQSSIKTVTIEDSVTSIGDYAFYNSYLTSITIPDGVTSIGSWTFGYCSSLTSITIPDSVTSIGEWAFYWCYSLTNITIPDSVTSIGEWAFKDCSSLTSITIDANNPNYCSIDGNLYNKNATTLIQYAIGKTDTSFAIPNSVTSIGDDAFYYCYSLTSITIPDSVTSIGNYAFSYCSSLTSITIPNSVTSIGSYAFYNCSSLTSINIPDGVTSIGWEAFRYCFYLEKIIYCGTSTEWNAITKGSYWDDLNGDYTANDTYTLQYHSYVDGVCEYCGASNPVSINNVNIAIGQDITVNYYAMIPDSYTNLTMQFTMGNKTATVAGVATGVANQYVFSFEGVSPQCMGDAITAKLYSREYLIAEKGAYTVKTYLEALINGDYSDETKAIAKDTLVYGGAAQVYKNYNTDAIVSDGITGSSHTLPGASGIELSNGAGATFTNATVWFDNINKLRVKFTADSTENLIVKINGVEAEYVLGDDGKYHVHTEALRATEFDKFFTFEIYINGELVSSLKYSVNSYVYTMLSSTNEPMKNLAIALYNYGYSADIYNKTPQTPLVPDIPEDEVDPEKADPTKSFQGEEHLFTPFG